MMFERPDSSLTSTRRSLPTASGLNMFVAVSDSIHGMDVHAAFVSERAGTDERLTVAEIHIGDFVDIT